MGLEEQLTTPTLVTSERRDSVLVVAIDNPPTAALSANVRRGLRDMLDRFERASDLSAMVITGIGTAFATGAGLNEDAPPDTPSLADICDRIEASAKPIVAAISGPALGGGLELALAAHLRVATPDARLGAPDITIGLVPNAGGTQRLPKVVGGVPALKLLLSGKAITGEAGKKVGLIDALSNGSLVDAAVEHAVRLAASGGELRRSSTRRDRLGEGKPSRTTARPPSPVRSTRRRG
jgi:3-hydroxyacyl-CoA dehydrogenase